MKLPNRGKSYEDLVDLMMVQRYGSPHSFICPLRASQRMWSFTDPREHMCWEHMHFVHTPLVDFGLIREGALFCQLSTLIYNIFKNVENFPLLAPTKKNSQKKKKESDEIYFGIYHFC
jgi:hypothetical protein